MANLQMLFKFEPQEAGRYTQYWQLNMEPLAACSDAAKVLLKFELSGQVSTKHTGFSLTDSLNIDFLSLATLVGEDYVLDAVCLSLSVHPDVSDGCLLIVLCL